MLQQGAFGEHENWWMMNEWTTNQSNQFNHINNWQLEMCLLVFVLRCLNRCIQAKYLFGSDLHCDPCDSDSVCFQTYSILLHSIRVHCWMLISHLTTWCVAFWNRILAGKNYYEVLGLKKTASEREVCVVLHCVVFSSLNTLPCPQCITTD